MNTIESISRRCCYNGVNHCKATSSDDSYQRVYNQSFCFCNCAIISNQFAKAGSTGARVYYLLNRLVAPNRLVCQLVICDTGCCSIRVFINVWKRQITSSGQKRYFKIGAEAISDTIGWLLTIEGLLYRNRRSSVEPVFQSSENFVH